MLVNKLESQVCILRYVLIYHTWCGNVRANSLAHLWGAYAIPMALSVVRHVSSVSTITTRNN